MMLCVLLAFIWPPHRLKKSPSSQVKIVISLIGFINFFILMIGFMFISESESFLYHGGFFILGIITLSIIASCVYPGSYLNSLLSLPYLTRVGRLSYSLYLWHYPVIVIINYYFINGQQPIYAYILQVILTILLAWFSYRFIELPFRGDGLKYFQLSKLKQRLPIVILLLSMISYTAYSLLQVAPDEATQVYTTRTLSTVTSPKLIHSVQWNESTESISDQYLAPLFIGDSILVDINQSLKQLYPNATIDGEVGRNIYKAIPLADQYQYMNKKNEIVVLGIGTNGDFQMLQLNQLLNKFSKANVYLVTTRVPRDYETHVNTLMKQAASIHKNVKIIDWYAASANHPEYFAYDGIHLESPGIQAMTQLFSDSIK